MNSKWLLPDDGVIDWIAVGIAASGTRQVRLTRLERALAAALIMRRGGSAYQVARSLFVSYSTAAALAASVRATPPDLSEAA